jgi:hypothetical protein
MLSSNSGYLLDYSIYPDLKNEEEAERVWKLVI